MKRILVLSDTHGDVRLAEEAIRSSLPLDEGIHLGDRLEDAFALEEALGLTFRTVAGNNDRYIEAPDELVFAVENVCIYACHGHLYDFHPHHPRREWNKSMALLLREAGKQGATCVLFGHTHEAYRRRAGKVLVMNPGCMWSGERTLSYGLLVINRDRVRGSIRTVKRQGHSIVIRKEPYWRRFFGR